MNYGCRWPIVRLLNPSKIAHYEALMRNADPAATSLLRGTLFL